MEKANYKLLLDSGWEFHSGDFPSAKSMSLSAYHTASQAGGAFCGLLGFFDADSWTQIHVPHDWLTSQNYDETVDSSGGYKKRGEAWYRNVFVLPSTPIESARLIFEGVLGQSTVYVNGVLAGRNFSGYNKFEFEIGDYLLPGEKNTIHVYVDARKAEGWWYEGNGLYRPVYVRFSGAAHLEKDDCFVRARRLENGWQVDADIGVRDFWKSAGAVVKAVLCDKNGTVLAEKTGVCQALTIWSFPIANAQLWSPQTPTLYTLTVSILDGAETVDSVCFQVGLRELEWRAGQGMFLNGQRYFVQGICGHQDHAGMGAAVTPEVMEYRVRVMKSLGANAYRCAHHAVTDDFLTLCDKYGLLVMAENRRFSVSEEVLGELRDMVRLSRNHPSVFLYSMFNEEPWQKDFRGKRMAKRMREEVRALDDTRAVLAAQNGGMLEKENASDGFDIIGLNYNLSAYEQVHERSPEKVILGTENCPTYATRGVLQTDTERQIFADNGMEYPAKFSESFQDTMVKMHALPYVAGYFVWTGMDHRGEPHPYGWPSVSSHWGFTDICGFDKEIAHWLRAWNTEQAFVHVLKNWNHKDGEEICVHVFTNADKAELFLNGCSLGIKAVVNRRAVWQVPFERGILRAIAVKDGIQVCDETHSAGKPFKLVLQNVTPGKGAFSKIIHIQAVDEKGVLVPDFCGEVRFVLDGGRVLGVGNGDPNSHHADAAVKVPCFNGLAQVIVSGDTQALQADCDGLKGDKITF